MPAGASLPDVFALRKLEGKCAAFGIRKWLRLVGRAEDYDIGLLGGSANRRGKRFAVSSFIRLSPGT